MTRRHQLAGAHARGSVSLPARPGSCPVWRNALLGPDDVDPGVQHPAQVGEVRLLLGRLVPQLSHLAERTAVDAAGVAR